RVSWSVKKPGFETRNRVFVSNPPRGPMRRFFPVIILAAFAPPAAAFEPTEKYEKREVRGWAVLVHPDVLSHKKDAEAAFAELDAQLKKITEAVPEKPLAALKKVRFWVEWEAKTDGAAEFHWSAGWLMKN